jgi:glycerate kinase
MRYLVAPDSFKGTLTAEMVVRVISSALKRADPSAEVYGMSLADGGEGTVDACMRLPGAERRTTIVHGPLGRDVEADWVLFEAGKSAVIETASCCGHAQVREHGGSALTASTAGLGMLVRAAEQSSAEKLYIGLGGSGTNDCGLGMAEALGYGIHYSTVAGPAWSVLEKLEHVEHIAATGAPALDIFTLCDVRNPLCGAQGATKVFGPQKGIEPCLIERFDAALSRFASVVRRDVHDVDPASAGMGAAGGLGFACAAFLNAQTVPGAQWLLEQLDFDKRCSEADVVITGEGRIDMQTAGGKLVQEVSRRASALGVPVIAFAGRMDGDPDLLRTALGLAGIYASMHGGMYRLPTSVEAGIALEKLVVEYATRKV